MFVASKATTADNWIVKKVADKADGAAWDCDGLTVSLSGDKVVKAKEVNGEWVIE